MNSKFYKMRRNRMISGVLAGLSDKWNFDVTLVRFLFAIFTVANFGLGVIIYIILASIMPTKEEIEAEMYGTGPRKRKTSTFSGGNLFYQYNFKSRGSTGKVGLYGL